jgi:radical SAM superfamily enzyme YgiQ (UPF0313 family)
LSDFNIDFYDSLTEDERAIYGNEQHKSWVEPASFRKISGKYKDNIERYSEMLIRSGPKIICFFINPGTRNFSIAMAKYIKERNVDKVILFGGSGVSTVMEREIVIERGVADYFIIGEAEETLHEFIQAYHLKKEMHGIKGLVADTEIKKFSPRKSLMPVDYIFPTYSDFDLAKYREKCLPILFNRGCVNKCVFCDNPFISGPMRSRHAASIFNEMMFHAKKNKITDFFVTDPTLSGNLVELEKLCDLLIRSKTKVTWRGMCLVRKAMGNDLIKKMAGAGCTSLFFGIETGSYRLLKKMGKGFRIEDAERILSQCKKNKIETLVNLFAGFPGETKEDIDQTIDFIRRNRQNIDFISKIDICFIVGGSYINRNRDKFKIKDYKSMFRWTDENGAGFEERKKNMQRIAEAARAEGLKILAETVEIEL